MAQFTVYTLLLASPAIGASAVSDHPIPPPITLRLLLPPTTHHPDVCEALLS